jgi:hypothetical protein
VAYGAAICREWCRRGFADTCETKILVDARAAGVRRVRSQATLEKAGRLPPWLGDPALHRSHQSSLVRKDPERYEPLFPGVPHDLPYEWPVRIESTRRRPAAPPRMTAR